MDPQFCLEIGESVGGLASNIPSQNTPILRENHQARSGQPVVPIFNLANMIGPSNFSYFSDVLLQCYMCADLSSDFILSMSSAKRA